MDDPWGSPWASTDAPSDNDPPPPPSRTNTFLSPPPKAFFGNGTGTGLGLSSPSPWSGHRDDDGFNVWGAGDRTDGADSPNEWGVWGESGVQPPRLSPRLSASGKESPLAWPENAAASPVFLGNSRSRTPSILRHNSPDPWAAELSLTNRPDIESPSPPKAATRDTLTIETGQVEQTSQTSYMVAEIGIRGDTNDDRPPVEDGFALGPNAYTEEGHPTTGLDSVHEDTNTGPKQDPVVDESPSRPSSTYTIDSHDRAERQDSPITSIDEDRGSRLQNTQRKTSGNVQEMAGTDDGLTGAASEEPPTLGQHEASRATSYENLRERGDIEDDNDGVDFGDMEDPATSARKTMASPGEASFSSEFSSTPKAESNDIFGRKPSHEREENDTNATDMTRIQPQKATNKFRDISFDTNLAGLDRLFPSLPDHLASGSAEDWEISDPVVSDSFATISERKSWYRISRYGSMRKHNSGDDENYHRVTWQTSHLRDDIVKIVRRWMEEDSYAGKATLGGTKRTGFFDWDSDAAPVKLDEVFRRKKSMTKHTRTTSIPAGDAVMKSASMMERPYRNSTGISLSKELPSINQSIMPIPSFGWNSEAPTIRSQHHQSQTTNLAPVPAPSPSSAVGQTASRRPAPIQLTSTDEDDDDWGEMVSSPRVTEAQIEPSVSAFPISQALTENDEPTPPLSLAIPNADQPMGLKPPVPEATQPTSSDPWSFSDFSTLDKPKQSHNSPSEHIPQVGTGFMVHEADTSLPNRDSLEVSSNKTAAINVPSKETAKASGPFNLPENDSQDDIIVQRILQSLPDLSYMLR
ncbi:hypothetical protein F4859DRAFT_460082 [Xylaria cf. heliscus]|nr:hypothetical protein F4859DRAFT_460082 [Xylaria cf. heliscus]